MSLTSNQIYSFGSAFVRALAIEKRTDQRRNNGLVVRMQRMYRGEYLVISKQRRLGKDSLKKKETTRDKKKERKYEEKKGS